MPGGGRADGELSSSVSARHIPRLLGVGLDIIATTLVLCESAGLVLWSTLALEVAGLCGPEDVVSI